MKICKEIFFSDYWSTYLSWYNFSIDIREYANNGHMSLEDAIGGLHGKIIGDLK